MTGVERVIGIGKGIFCIVEFVEGDEFFYDLKRFIEEVKQLIVVQICCDGELVLGKVMVVLCR